MKVIVAWDGAWKRYRRSLSYFSACVPSSARAAGGTTSWNRHSLAAKVGWSAWSALKGTPSPLQKEVAAISPRLAVLMYGSNDIEGKNPFSYANNMLDIVDQLEFPSILVLPLTTRTVDNPANLLRVRIPPRGGLERPSEIIINWSCSVDLKNLDLTDGPLTVLETAELRELEEKFALYCGMGGG